MHAGIWKKNRGFRPISRFFSEMIQDGPQLLWNANRNSYAINPMVPFPMTLRDLELSELAKYSVTPRLARKYQWYISTIYTPVSLYTVVSRYFQAKNSWYFFIFSKYQPLLFTYFSIHAYLTQTAQVPLNDAKILPKILTLWVGRNNATYDRHRRTAHGIRRT